MRMPKSMLLAIMVILSTAVLQLGGTQRASADHTDAAFARGSAGANESVKVDYEFTVCEGETIEPLRPNAPVITSNSNPAVADATIDGEGHIVITGKTAGVTDIEVAFASLDERHQPVRRVMLIRVTVVRCDKMAPGQTRPNTFVMPDSGFDTLLPERGHGEPVLPAPATPLIPTAPAMTCCEANINLNGRPTIVEGETGLLFNRWRTIRLVIDIPIELDCLEGTVPDQKCIGRFDVAVAAGDHPTQAGAAPTLSTVDIIKWGEWKCNTGHHTTTVRVEYAAVYPGAGAVTGDLKLTLTLPAGKTGNINHTYAVDINADGKKLKATPNNNPKNDPGKDARDPQPK